MPTVYSDLDVLITDGIAASQNQLAQEEYDFAEYCDFMQHEHRILEESGSDHCSHVITFYRHEQVTALQTGYLLEANSENESIH